MITRSSRRARLGGLAALIAIPTLILGLSGCSAPAQNGTPAPGNTPAAGAAGAPQSMAEWQLAYAQCMRDEGVDMPDPSADGGMTLNSNNMDTDATNAAAKKCHDKLGQPTPSADEKAAIDQANLEWGRQVAECYRENGYDMADPKAGEALQWPQGASDDVQQKCGSASNTTQSTGN